MISDRVQRIGYSPTLRITAKARAMREEGIDVIDLSVGEPDFPTPEFIKEAAKKAIDENYTKYTANSGMPELKKAIIRRLHEDYGVTYNPNQIIVSSGAKNCLYNLCIALLNKGEEAIIPAPYWVSYPHMVNLAKGVPVVVPTREENGFRLTAKELSRTINSNTKALFLNNPSNPTGSAYSREELEDIVEIAVNEGLVIIADEIYSKLVYDGFRFVSVASLGEDVKKNTVIINGFSKAYAMTGWRLGYAAGPEELIAGMDKVQSHNTSNASSVSQMAGIAALNGPQNDINKMLADFQRRRDYMHYRLMQIPGVSCYKPQGAFYVFPNFSAYYDMAYESNLIRNSHGLAYYLLKHSQVAIVPGDAFGADTFVRLSYATSMEKIEQALDRISKAIEKLTPVRKKEAKPLNNTVTKRTDFVETEVNISMERRDALVAESEDFLTHEGYYEWNVNIAGMVIQLRTNSPHLYDFWLENFYPAQLETDLEPHAVIYAINWITGREPGAYYNSDSRTAFYFKSAFYPQLRSLALGIVQDITERLYDLHVVRAQSIDVNGKAMLFMGAPGTGKMTQFAEFLRLPYVKLHSSDVVFLRYLSGQAVADVVERKFLMKTDFVEKMPTMAPLFEKSKCENVITSKDDCTNETCKNQDDCQLDQGAPYCFKGASVSTAMLDPYWLGGPEKHVKRSAVKSVIIFSKDALSPAIQKLNPEDAIKILEEGRAQNEYGAIRNIPFFNPYLLIRSMDRIELQKRYFKKLFQIVPCYIVNTSKEPAKDIFARLKALSEDDVETALK